MHDLEFYTMLQSDNLSILSLGITINHHCTISTVYIYYTNITTKANQMNGDVCARYRCHKIYT